MGIRKILGSLAILLTFFSAPAKAAEECGPLQLVTSLPLTPQDGHYLVPVTINDKAAQMVLNTGAGISNINGAAADALGLHPIKGASIKMLDTAGNVSDSYVGIDSFAMGAIRANKTQFMLAPSERDGSVAGSIGGDIMALYDLDLDFAASKVNFFSHKHCPGHVIYWQAPAVATMPISLMQPTESSTRQGFNPYVNRGAHIWVPVDLDGKRLQAMISTSGGASTISASTAKFMFGVEPDSPDAAKDPLTGQPKAFPHVFSTLTFGDVTVKNPHFIVVPDLIGSRDPNNSIRTDTRAARVDDTIKINITVGTEILRKLHLYVAFGERQLYVTPASAPAAPK